jgi:hypothetical protein
VPAKSEEPNAAAPRAAQPAPGLASSPAAPAPAAPLPTLPPSPAPDARSRLALDAPLARPGAAGSCRVMSVSKDVQRAGAPLRAGELLDAQQRLELGDGAALHLVHTASARQWTLSGPARAFACEGGAEEIVLARGALRTEPGSGVRPGAEVWVGTPFGTLRYADARADIRVAREALQVEVSSGSLWFSPLDDEAGERELQAGSTTFPARRYRPASAAALARCERAASAAEALARTLRSDALQALGARAREHVRARQRAHAACSGALAALLAGDDGAGQSEQSRAGYSALASYDRQWRAVP